MDSWKEAEELNKKTELDLLIQDILTMKQEDITSNEGEIFTLLDRRVRENHLIKESYNEIKSSLADLCESKLGYSFTKDNEEDLISDLVDEANKSQQDIYYVYPVWEVHDPKVLIRAGFFPTSIDVKSKWFNDWLNGMDLDSIRFWYDEYVDRVTELKSLSEESRWVYRSFDEWKRIAITQANSIGLLLFGSDSVYSESKRPVNDMSMFRTPISFRCNPKDIYDNKLIIQDEEWNLIPAVRYAAGMRRGLFDPSETPAEFCGTFYYNEPESTTYLAYKTSHRSFNKYTCIIEMFQMMESETPGLLDMLRTTHVKDLTLEEEIYKTALAEIEDENSFKILKQFIDGTIPLDLMMTPNDAYDILPVSSIYPSTVPQKKYYTATYLHLYAAEDTFDQPLCLLCKRLGIDILILENMVGSFQVVTEILDSRDRKDSFKSLVYTQ